MVLSGWMNESLINSIKNNVDMYMDCYDMIFTWSEELCLSMNIKWIPGSGSWIKEPQIYQNKLVSIIVPTTHSSGTVIGCMIEQLNIPCLVEGSIG